MSIVTVARCCWNTDRIDIRTCAVKRASADIRLRMICSIKGYTFDLFMRKGEKEENNGNSNMKVSLFRKKFMKRRERGSQGDFKIFLLSNLFSLFEYRWHGGIAQSIYIMNDINIHSFRLVFIIILNDLELRSSI